MPNDHATAQAEFNVEVARVWDEGVARLGAGANPGTPFQHSIWLSAWYASLGSRRNLSPLIVVVREAETRRLSAVFPLVVNSAGTHRVIEFADLGISDYNAPLLFEAAPSTPADAEQMLRTVAAALRGEADILRLNKMPRQIGNAHNPLALLDLSRASPLGSNVVRIDGSWEDYRRSLDRKDRKELERSWRVFQRTGENARFVRASTRDEALQILSAIVVMQRERIASLGKSYVLDDEGCLDFYRELIESGLDAGYTIVTALVSGQSDVVAGLFSIADGNSLAMVRLGQAGRDWAQCSPGRLLIDRTMHTLHSTGMTEFDFTTGDYSYKSVFRVERTPLVDLTYPLSWRGRASIKWEELGDWTKRHLRALPILYTPLKRLADFMRERPLLPRRIRPPASGSPPTDDRSKATDLPHS